MIGNYIGAERYINYNDFDIIKSPGYVGDKPDNQYDEYFQYSAMSGVWSMRDTVMYPHKMPEYSAIVRVDQDNGNASNANSFTTKSFDYLKGDVFVACIHWQGTGDINTPAGFNWALDSSYSGEGPLSRPFTHTVHTTKTRSDGSTTLNFNRTYASNRNLMWNVIQYRNVKNYFNRVITTSFDTVSGTTLSVDPPQKGGIVFMSSLGTSSSLSFTGVTAGNTTLFSNWQAIRYTSMYNFEWIVTDENSPSNYTATVGSSNSNITIVNFI